MCVCVCVYDICECDSKIRMYLQQQQQQNGVLPLFLRWFDDIMMKINDLQMWTIIKKNFWK